MNVRRAAIAALLALLLAPIVAAEPQAFFSLDKPVVAAGEPVTADATESRAAASFAWRWDEGDEYHEGNRSETHVYVQPGVHLVGLRIADATGAEGYANQTLLVKGSVPTAYVTPSKIERDSGVEFTGNASFSEHSLGATKIAKYEWDWGEGAGFFVGNVTETHFYAHPGTWRATLRVTDDLGRNATYVYPILVKSTFFTRMRQVWDDRASFIDGAKLTLELAIVTTIVGFVLAIVIALLRISHLKLLKWPAAIYIEVIRGTPLLVQVLICWLVLPYFGVKLSPLYAGGLALIINTSAYQAEAIRAGIQAIPTGQMEAATSLGLSYLQAMRFVIIPQAFRLTLPALGNEFIILLKDTSLVSVIGVVELTAIGRIFAARTFLVLEPFAAIALVYFVMTYGLSSGLRYLEKRLAIPGLGLQGAA